MKIRRSANVDSQNQDLVATIAHRFHFFLAKDVILIQHRRKGRNI